jgi:hypothetical protein
MATSIPIKYSPRSPVIPMAKPIGTPRTSAPAKININDINIESS